MIYKCRAECGIDIDRFLAKTIGRVFYVFRERWHGLPDCDLLFESNLSKDRLLEILRTIPDAHVMRQTLNTSKEYTGERDFSIE